ncbi:acyltransferase family protein [Leeuwenhoekiella parthenopeia]|uniref:Heparan-alpha-glucosaminide N-acetyltransferase domain-containing protein n=1 Tax=Leeuwenhoekiella parthenopeia TaxID=2890320 RepID=A0ABS8GUG8_9FLAO|nr:heparan-alpha-glucosaminide N-acetyltransferase domain-containing protein [Leeuwenhoekiella parthenopeia]MCC4213650.1 heparan-alpha-glucosaminide N-acetyltransferase domain-containing protein [Leeuwenhoekiella parthenopeia]
MTVKTSERFLSLDVFRGLTIALMILVNTPGTGAEMYPYLVHAQWFGFTLADLVFPSFLFAVGNAMSFSMRRFQEAVPADFWKKVLKRTAIIFLLGFLMYWFPFFEFNDGQLQLSPFSETRVMGVLQRIALCYFFGAVLVRYFSVKAIFIACIVMLLAYWGILYAFGEPGRELEMATNAAAKFDFTILGEGHIYKKDAIPFDPEGILSTLPSIVNVLAGYLAGVFIRRKGKSFETIAKLMLAGFIIFALAEWWGLIFPISKKLWTSPFALLTIGLNLSMLAALIFAVELKNIKFGSDFFNTFGKNPLVIYLFSELFYITLRLIPVNENQDAFEWVSEEIFQRIFPGSFGALMTAIVFMLVCWALGYWMDKKKIYVKI